MTEIKIWPNLLQIFVIFNLAGIWFKNKQFYSWWWVIALIIVEIILMTLMEKLAKISLEFKKVEMRKRK